jgi:hypothetical protein
MKTLSFAPLLVVSAAMLHGAETALPEFNTSTIGVPPLSLSEAAKVITKKPSTFAAKLPTFDDARSGGLLGANQRASIADIPRAQSRIAPKAGLWNMPVLTPNPNIDHKIVLQEPDPRVDFKMLVKPPGSDVQPVK